MQNFPTTAAVALSQLTHNRWALPVLARVAQDGGCKLVTLRHHLGASHANLTRALLGLEALGLVIPNPGYGHPMRPEYVLGPVGLCVHELPGAIVAWTKRIEATDQLLKKWQLPVLVALGSEVCRFGEVRSQIRPATPRAVTMALKCHASYGLVAREVQQGYPPIPLYQVTALAKAGCEPATLLGELLASQHI